MIVTQPLFAAGTTRSSAAECSVYNDYVNQQCIPKKLLANTMDPEILDNYTQQGCRDDAYTLILESDSVARDKCDPIKVGKFIFRLRSK